MLQVRQHGWQWSRLLGSSKRPMAATQITQLRALTATTLAPQRLAVLPRWPASSAWHSESPRRSYALKAGRKRRKGGAKRAGDEPAPSTQDARIRSTPRNSLGTNFGGQRAAAAPAAIPDAFETAEHALQTLRRVYAGVKDMESSNEGMVVSIDDEAGRVTVEIPGFEPTAGPQVPGGTYSLEYNASKGQLVLYSPFDHTTHAYELNTMYDAWMHVDDEHQLLELLMRHMTSRCNGYPAF